MPGLEKPLSLAALTLLTSLQAAEINWGAPFNIANDPSSVLADFDPARNGGAALTGASAVVEAVNYGYSGVTVNGIAFSAFTGNTDFWGFSGIDPQIDSLLSGHTAFSAPYGVQTKSITLGGLIPGQRYQVQIIVAHDNRSASNINLREYEIGRGSAFTGSFVPVLTRGADTVGASGTVVGTFVADATTQQISIRSNQQDGNLSDDPDPAISGYVMIGDFEDANGDGEPDNWPPAPEPIDFATLQPIPSGETAERRIERAAKLLPRPSQVEWQRLETSFFIHFGPNTFNGVEWGNGFESPSIFNPTALNARQWVDAMADAGGRLLILVVKHHEGFCLWPSRYTAHDVASSPWRGGNGDLLREVAEACAARGMKLGVYLSPADLYQIETTGPEGYYGNASTSRVSTIPTDPSSFSTAPQTGRAPAPGFPARTYTVDDYNRYFLNQLYELLTEYGEITEVWFDGANPKPGTSQIYQHDAWYDLIRSLQPNAVIFGKGPDLRWVGNESGIARETEWSVIPLPSHPDDFDWSDLTGADLGSRSKLVPGSFLWWYPAEADVPILNGWFWNSSKVPKSVSTLIDIHYQSVGRNANLLLNLSPDTRGLIPENQLSPLSSMAQVIRNTFASDLAQGSTGAPGELLDNNPDSFAEAPEGQSIAEWTLDLPSPRTFDVVCLQEPIAQRGQRIEGFAVDTWNGGTWTEQATATTIGHKRLLRLSSPVTTARVRIRITACRLNPSLATVSLHKQAVSTAAPVIGERSPSGMVAITHPAGKPLRYTLDGSEPGTDSTTYTGPAPLPLGGTLRVVAIGDDGLPGVEASRVFPDVSSSGWVADADQENQAAALAIDGNPATTWAATGTSTPHWLRIDMGSPRWIGGFTYLPPTGGGAGTATSYRFETSDNGSDWTVRSAGTFGNMANNPVRQDVTFDAVKTRWVRLTVLADVASGTSARAAEVSVIAAGFDAWKRDRGQSSLLPTDPLGGNTALAEYVFGSGGGMISASRTAPSQLSLRVRTRAGLPDITPSLQISPDLSSWAAPAASTLTESTAIEGWQETAWAVAFPAEWPTGFTRATFNLR